ncbi:translocation/assembly module TamB domain-containing protein [Xylophilus sp. GOD-11R]|uniref:translocation/assembly module TamB domain-containing protein n=1 Tax=Xylophilus sp. GOD-11R TaxID=3089814 RepID=UPI00298C503A|nr:translocation/assembly module TamB domain-containing protein [Xylophilus sp. GOD-11R]WPB56626.1 translocation/assembly module TamB domain-containing protein [Xylophilus sp. GOD-11R]
MADSQDTSATPNEPGPSSPPIRPRRRPLRWITGILLALVLVVVALVAAGWIWAGGDRSLATALTRAAAYMPEGQTLESRDVTGSLRTGGHIGFLRWNSPTLTVEVQDATIAWQLAPLLRRQVSLGEVHVKSVAVERHGEPDKTPTEPLQELTLPVDIDLPFRVDTIRWAGPPEVLVQNLAGRFRYQDGRHQLAIDGVDVMDGHYSLEASLQGAAPMALEALLQGRVQAPMPEGIEPLTVGTGVHAGGTLSGTDARLQVAAAVRPADGSALRADVLAQVAPWLPQPLLSAHADLNQLDLARLSPKAPATLLGGSVDAGPVGAGWQVKGSLRNDAPGPWDQGKLPVQQADVAATQGANGVWTIEQAVVRAGGGEITAQGRYGPPPATVAEGTTATPAPWEVVATLAGIQPGALHTALVGPTLSGKAQASQQGEALDFDVAITGAGTGPSRKGSASALQALGLQSVAAVGRWSGGVLDLRQFKLRANDASADGVAQVRPADRAGKGKITASVPGAQLSLDGDMAPTSGAGKLQLALANAGTLQRWIENIPGLRSALGGITLDGSARLDAQWRGGWESALKRWQQGGTSGADLNLQATLASPRLDIGLPASSTAPAATPTSAPASRTGARSSTAAVPAAISSPAEAPRSAPSSRRATTVALRDFRAELTGSLAQANLSLQGSASTGAQTAKLNTRASGGVDGPGRWRAAIAQLQLEAADRSLPGPWKIDLDAPLSVQIRQTATSLSVETSGSSASLSGPAPGKVGIVWQPINLQTSGSGAAAQMRLRSQGQLKGLPMAWAQALSAAAKDAIAQSGFAGDLVFDGTWDIDAGDTLRARASLSRVSGDIRVQEPGSTATPAVIATSGTGAGVDGAKASAGAAGNVPTISAGVIAARVEVAADGNDVRADVLWDSARAGVVKASATTRLTRGAEGWSWAEDAPIGGSVDASLPQVGAWSVLAPPGWRVQGSFEAKAQLSGTRTAPRWSGTLDANGLAVRSVVDGIDLHDGRLRTRLEGDHLDITEFSLRGGTGPGTRIAGLAGSRATAGAVANADGGTLRGSGSLSWADGIRMNVETRLEALRVSVRTDRQVTLSGTLQAKLGQDGQLVLRGNLRTDRAVILLPDDSAPTLGADVFVHSAALDREAAAKAEKAGAAPTSVGTAKPPDIVVVFNLGNDFAVQGKGITTRLTGELEIRSTAGLNVPPRVTGEIRTVSGQYRAYSQQLDIESGVASFSGAYDNPALNILAIRPNITVRAGVQVTGTAQAPRVRLYSESGLTDAEILSWVVLGRSTANGGAEAALLQQAALALLSGDKGSSGGVAKKLGLDEIGFKGPGSGNNASAAALTFGKRLSQNLYVTYEAGLSGAVGSLYIFYDLTRRLTLRGQAGSTKNGLDLIYTLMFN